MGFSGCQHEALSTFVVLLFACDIDQTEMLSEVIQNTNFSPTNRGASVKLLPDILKEKIL